MDNIERLIDFFELENSRDWEAYEKYLSDDIKWTLYYNDSIEVINGKSEYMDRIQRCYRNNSDTFKVESTVVSEGGKTIVSFLINQFEQQSCDIFQFKDGKIISETEYLLGKIQ